MPQVAARFTRSVFLHHLLSMIKDFKVTPLEPGPSHTVQAASLPSRQGMLVNLKANNVGALLLFTTGRLNLIVS